MARRRLNHEASPHRRDPLLHADQAHAAPIGRPIGVESAAVIHHGQGNAVRLSSKLYRHRSCLGVSRHIRQRFLQHAKQDQLGIVAEDGR